MYDRIDDYRWLAEQQTARALKPGGACLAFVNSKWVTRVLFSVQTDNPLLSLTLRNGPAPMNGRVISKTHYVVWFCGNNLVGYMPDNWHTPQRPSYKINGHNHSWTKDPTTTSRRFSRRSPIPPLSSRPFTGGGTVPTVCKMLRRHYLAFEI